MKQNVVGNTVSNAGAFGSRKGDDEVRSLPAKWINVCLVVCLFLFAAFAPHSIAATQISWMLGMLLWVARFACYPPPKLSRTPVDYAFLSFFLLTGLSALLSYEPLVSIGKLRAASLFTIVYLFAENIPSRRVLRLLVLTLIASCMINVIYTLGERAVGRGIKVAGVSANSPLARAVTTVRLSSRPEAIRDGDTLLEVDGQPLSGPGYLAAALASLERTPALIKIYRTEWVATLAVPRGRLLPGTTPEEQLGISSWSRGRDWRASGFYGHYVTYAESLQLILALTAGLFVSLPLKRSWPGILLAAAITGMVLALLLTVTRASWLSFLIATTVIVFLGSSRRTILILIALGIPLVLAGLFFLQQKRNVSFFDQHDDSTVWREKVWRDGFQLLVSKPRHLLFGVGMDSIKSHWREWGLFDNGRMPMGHMHSNLLQLALERGLPALSVWLILLAAYARVLWRLISPARSRKNLSEGSGLGGVLLAKLQSPETPTPSEKAMSPVAVLAHQAYQFQANDSWIERGLALGALGGLAGFFASGLVHYNWGDSEVVMIFYFITGLSLFLDISAHQEFKHQGSR